MRVSVTMMKDSVQRFIIEQANIRGQLVRLHTSFQTIVKQHQYPTAIRELLGEVLVAACLLSAIIKFNGRLAVQFQGEAPLKLLLAQCTEQFAIRGLAQFQPGATANDLKKGLLMITISSEQTAKPYQGIVTWQGNSLAASLEHYFKESEQLPTRLWLAVDDTSAVGLLLQPLPSETTDSTAWEHITCLTETLTAKELLQWDNTTLLHKLYSEETITVFDPAPVAFKCNCSSDRCANAILLLGRAEAEAELHEKQALVVTCDFCNQEYTFERAEVEALFAKN